MLQSLDFSPLLISLKISITALLFTFFLGILAARFFLHKKSTVSWFFDVVFTLPMVLPPTVVGFLLLVILGNNSVLGQAFAKMGFEIIFTWKAAVIAAVAVSFPLMYRAARGAFEQVDDNLLQAARTIGMSEGSIFFRLLLPLAWPGLAAGAVLAFARALGEFGATLMIAGNIPGVTQTIPLAIYFATASGKNDVAAVWSAIIIVISFVALGFINYSGRRDKF